MAHLLAEGATLPDFVLTLELDVRRFAQELDDGTHLPMVQRDFDSGIRSGVGAHEYAPSH